MRARLRRATAAALVTLIGLAATAASAMAGTVSVSGSTIVYVDADGQWQDLYAAQDGGTYYFLDFRWPIIAGTGCTPNVGPPLGTYTVKCEGAGITSVEVDAGGGNDDVNMGSVAVHSDVDGGAGNDHLTGGFGDDTLYGGDGDDRLDDGAISGAPPAGDDVFLGGPGSDTVSYQSTFEPVSVTLDGVADDGVAGSADNAGIDVENIIGGGEADVLTGNASANRIEAGSGLAADTLNGLDGDDTLMGEGGDGDVLNGGGADDRLDGGWGADIANGGAGDDTFEDTGLINGSLDDTFNGGAGIDTADYGDRVGRVVADLDGEIGDDGELAHDPQPAEHDTLGADVEDLIGGRADDALTGNGSDNLLVGGLCTQPGPAGCIADALHGAAGDDALIAGAEDSNCPSMVCGTQGSAILDGGTGDDVLITVYGRAEMTGGEGDDDLWPAPAGDIAGSDLSGGSGRDSVDFSTAAEPVSVSLDNVADDGPDGADENIRADIEDVFGGDFDDLLIGHAEANQLDGGEGDDVLAGGPGPDHLSGGSGADVADYSDHQQAVVVRFNGQSGSGGLEDGAGDAVQPDVEDAWGGEGNDTLIGNNVSNLLNGGPGADVLTGGGDEDFADYSERTEGVTIAADGTPNSGNAADGAPAARDTLAADIEHLFGGDGPDRLTGNASANFLDAGPGDDVLDSRDQGADDNVCGFGSDSASVDLLDLYDTDCERVLLPVLTVGPSSSPQPGAPQPTAPLAVTLQLPRGQRFRSMLDTGLRLRATCTSACDLRAGALLSAGAAEDLRLGSGRRSVRVAGGRGELGRAGSKILTLRFTRKAKARLPRLRSTRLTIHITATHGSAATTLERRLVVTRKRARLLSASAAALVRRTDVPPVVPGLRGRRALRQRAVGDG